MINTFPWLHDAGSHPRMSSWLSGADVCNLIFSWSPDIQVAHDNHEKCHGQHVHLQAFDTKDPKFTGKQVTAFLRFLLTFSSLNIAYYI